MLASFSASYRVKGHGLMNPNTTRGWSAAVSRIFEDVNDDEDVRAINIPAAVRKYHNKHPGDLKGTVLKEYERRLARAVTDFTSYTEDPTKYEGRGRGPNDAPPKPRKSKDQKASATPQDTRIVAGTGSLATSGRSATSFEAPPKLALAVDFNLRPDFLAQVVLPRDLKVSEARRLVAFIMAMATDYEPKTAND
jgi:hypothetical protein